MLTEFEAVANAAAVIKMALDEKVILVNEPMRMKTVFCYGPHVLGVTLPHRAQSSRQSRASWHAGMPESEVLQVITKVTNDAELARTVSYFLKAVGVRLHHPMMRCGLIRQMAAL